MFDNKIVLVTGGSRGIGKAVALEFAKANATVLINYTSSDDAANKAIEEMKSINQAGTFESFKFDVSNYQETENEVKNILDKYSKIDILVNNAGITRDSLFMRMKESQWDEVFDVNIKGIFNCTKNVVRSMIKNQYGKIISIYITWKLRKYKPRKKQDSSVIYLSYRLMKNRIHSTISNTSF